jgi:hypothetical protein
MVSAAYGVDVEVEVDVDGENPAICGKHGLFLFCHQRKKRLSQKVKIDF